MREFVERSSWLMHWKKIPELVLLLKRKKEKHTTTTTTTTTILHGQGQQ